MPVLIRAKILSQSLTVGVTMTKAFSYIRFSSKVQEKGDSLRRQKQLAIAYCEANGLELDKRSFEDLGLSAFRGENAKAGELYAFLKGVENNRIPADSWLLVESLDRLSRDTIDAAISLFIQIKSLGITIVSLQDNKIYRGGGSNDNNTIDMMMAMMVFMRANNESETKSKRVKAAWNNKRATGQRLTRICPSWLQWDDSSNSFIVVEKEASVIKLIYQMAYNGDGSHVIAKHLNAEGIKSPTGKAWSPSMVLLRLKNKSVIGWHDPKDSNNPPIKDYYPAIIDESVYYKVEQMIALRELNKVSGRKGSDTVASLFVRKMTCGLCGGVVRAVSRSNSKAYMRCTTAYQSQHCKAQSLPVDEAEACILAAIFLVIGHTLSAFEILGKDDDNIRLQISEKESMIKDLTMDLVRLRDRTPILHAIDMLQADIAALRKQLDKHPVTDLSSSFMRGRDAYLSMLKIQCADIGVSDYLSKYGLNILSGLVKLDNIVCNEDIQIYRKRLQSEIMGLVSNISVSGYEEEDENGWYRMVDISGPILGMMDEDNWPMRIPLSVNGPQKWLRRYRRDKI